MSEQIDHTKILSALDQIMQQRKNEDPSTSYVASLYHDGLDKILEKVGEEATEVIIAAKNAENDSNQIDPCVAEIADLWFHTLVLLAQTNRSSDHVLQLLASRFGISGHDEKASRSS